MTITEAKAPDTLSVKARVERSTNANVDRPAHYVRGKTQVADFIAEQQLNFDLGNVVKYVCRCDAKTADPIEALRDLKKARWYLEHEITLRADALVSQLAVQEETRRNMEAIRAEKQSKRKGGNRGR